MLLESIGFKKLTENCWNNDRYELIIFDDSMSIVDLKVNDPNKRKIYQDSVPKDLKKFLTNILK